MKKAFALALLFALAIVSAAAESSLKASVAQYRSAETWEKQLARLYDLAAEHTEAIQGDWEIDLTASPAEPLPDKWRYPRNIDGRDVIRTEALPDEFRDARLLVLYQDRTTGDDDFAMLGEIYARIPERMRARTLDEADAVFCLCYNVRRRDDYTGNAYDRRYWAYLYQPGGKVYCVYSKVSSPPGYGTGFALYGEEVSLETMWKEYKGLKTLFEQSKE